MIFSKLRIIRESLDNLAKRLEAIEYEVNRPKRMFWTAYGQDIKGPKHGNMNLTERVNALEDKIFPRCDHCGARDCQHGKSQ